MLLDGMQGKDLETFARHTHKLDGILISVLLFIQLEQTLENCASHQFILACHTGKCFGQSTTFNNIAIFLFGGLQLLHDLIAFQLQICLLPRNQILGRQVCIGVILVVHDEDLAGVILVAISMPNFQRYFQVGHEEWALAIYQRHSIFLLG